MLSIALPRVISSRSCESFLVVTALLYPKNYVRQQILTKFFTHPQGVDFGGNFWVLRKERFSVDFFGSPARESFDPNFFDVRKERFFVGDGVDGVEVVGFVGVVVDGVDVHVGECPRRWCGCG